MYSKISGAGSTSFIFYVRATDTHCLWPLSCGKLFLLLLSHAIHKEALPVKSVSLCYQIFYYMTRFTSCWTQVHVTYYSRLSVARTLTAVSNSFFGPLKKSHSCIFGIILGIFFFILIIGILCVLIRIASIRRFQCDHTTYLHVEENRKDIPIMLPELVL